MQAWTDLEFDVLETVTRRIKVMTDEQLTQALAVDAGSDRTAIERLLRAALVLTTTINARPLPKSPFVVWESGTDSPDFDPVWRRVREQCHQDSLPTRVYWAAPQTANLFGVKGGTLSSISERNNDLRLAEAYVRHRARADHTIWLNAMVANKRYTTSIPADAAIVGTDGVLQRVIVIARGDSQRLRDFHAACVRSGLAYEVW